MTEQYIQYSTILASLQYHAQGFKPSLYSSKGDSSLKTNHI